MTDSHTHLTNEVLYQDLDLVISQFISVGGVGLLNVGHDPESNLLCLKIADQYKNYPDMQFETAIGLHPDFFYQNSQYTNPAYTYDSANKYIRQFEDMLTRNIQNVSAIGETGLDYYHVMMDTDLSSDQKEETIEIQKNSFRKHVELALQYKLPLTIHTREIANESRCIVDALEIICEVGHGRVCGSFHSYTGDSKYIDDIIDLGFKIGFNGIITYKSADNVREILKQTPIDRILLETDAPLLPPRSVRNNKKLAQRYGQPSDALEIVKTVAEVKDVSLEMIEKATDKNFEEMMGK